MEPKAFKRNQNAKELENFIFNVEQYFKVTETYLEELKVTLATMHLIDKVKLIRLWRLMLIYSWVNGYIR